MPHSSIRNLFSARPATVGLVVALPLLAASIGCQQRASFRVSEIEVTRSDNDNVTTSEITYNDDGTVDEMERKVNGSFDIRFEADYDQGVFEKITVVDDNDEPYDFEFTWDGPLLVEVETDNQFYRTTYDYDGSTPDTLEELDRTYQYFDSTSLNENIEFERNDDGQLAEVKSTSTFEVPIFGDTITVVTNEYDWDEGLLKGITRSTTSGNNTDVDDFDFDYNDEGLLVGNRLDEVDAPGLSYNIEYDDQGRIVEIERTDGDDIVTTRYTYEDGNSNIVWEPALPYASSFDLSGKAYPSVELMTVPLLLGDF